MYMSHTTHCCVYMLTLSPLKLPRSFSLSFISAVSGKACLTFKLVSLRGREREREGEKREREGEGEKREVRKREGGEREEERERRERWRVFKYMMLLFLIIPI